MELKKKEARTVTKEDKERTAGRQRVSSQFDTQRAEVAVSPQDAWEAYCKSIGDYDANTDDDVEDDEEDDALPSPALILNREPFLKWLHDNKKTPVVAPSRDTEAAHFYPSMLSLVSTVLQNDGEVVLAAVRQCSSALQYASIELRGSKEVVLEAVQNHDCSCSCCKDLHPLQFASDTLRADKEVVMVAVQHSALALRYAEG